MDPRKRAACSNDQLLTKNNNNTNNNTSNLNNSSNNAASNIESVIDVLRSNTKNIYHLETTQSFPIVDSSISTSAPELIKKPTASIRFVFVFLFRTSRSEGNCG